MSSLPDPRAEALRRAPAMRRWAFALKLPSWPKLFVPSVFGQALGASFEGRWSWSAAALGFAFSLCLLIYIVLINDVADQRVDAIKRQRFAQDCSPKTIVDEILPAWQLLLTGSLAAGAGVAVAFAAEGLLARRGTGVAGVVCFALLALYSLPPVRLNYRGGGELLEALGVGLILPAFHIYLQSPVAVPYYLAALWGSTLLAFSSAVASGLSDEETDREGGKCTVASRFGNATARSLTELLALAGLAAWVLGVWFGVAPLWLPSLLVAVAGGWHWLRLRRLSPEALTNRFAEQARYKARLHRLIWDSALLFAAAVVIQRAL